MISKSTPRSKIYASLASNLHSKEMVSKWLGVAENAFGSIVKGSPVSVDVVSSTFDPPNKLIVKLIIGLEKDSDVLLRNEGLIRRKINEKAGRSIVGGVVHTSLLFAQIEIVDGNICVIYHDARLDIPGFIDVLKTINGL
jgi:hypothetical protein